MVDILLPAPMHPAVMDGLAARFAVHRLWEAADPDALLADAGPRIRGMAVSTLAGPVSDALFARLPALEIVANFGVGYDNVDVAAAVARGIRVTNTPDVLTDETADLALGLLLATLRRIPAAERHLRAGQWLEAPFPLSPSLRGRTVGILGLGAIGRAVARRLEGFGVAIRWHGRSAQDAPWPRDASVLDLANACDTLIITVPGGAATRHMVEDAVLRALGPQGVLINVARGSVVDEAALIAALRDGTILAAGLDVYEDEPRVPAALLALENAVLLPHVGSGSVRTRKAMADLVVDNLVGWFLGSGPKTLVAECRGSTPAQ